MTTGSVFILLKKTDFDTILTFLWGKVYWCGSHKVFVTEVGGVAVTFLMPIFSKVKSLCLKIRS